MSILPGLVSVKLSKRSYFGLNWHRFWFHQLTYLMTFFKWTRWFHKGHFNNRNLCVENLMRKLAHCLQYQLDIIKVYHLFNSAPLSMHCPSECDLNTLEIPSWNFPGLCFDSLGLSISSIFLLNLCCNRHIPMRKDSYWLSSIRIWLETQYHGKR